MSIGLAILYVIYVFICVALILFVLLQQTRGGGLAGAFGGGGGDTFFGYTSMQKIGRWTIYLAVAFCVLSLVIANWPYKPQSDSLADFGTFPEIPATGSAAPSTAGGTTEAQPQPAAGAEQAPPPAPVPIGE